MLKKGGFRIYMTIIEKDKSSNYIKKLYHFETLNEALDFLRSKRGEDEGKCYELIAA